MRGFDFERFEEVAAWLEADDGMSRFQAEVYAAARQGVQRWEALQCKQRMKYFDGLESQCGGWMATSGQPAPSAASTGRKSETPVSASHSSRMGSFGIAGTAV